MSVCVCVYVPETLNSQQVSCQPMDNVLLTKLSHSKFGTVIINVVINNTVHDNDSSDYCNVY